MAMRAAVQMQRCHQRLVANSARARFFASSQEELQKINAQIEAQMKELEKMRAAKMQVEEKIMSVTGDRHRWREMAESSEMLFKSDSLTSLTSVADASMAQGAVIRAWDGCMAAAHVAYAMSEDAFIFPITPSSPMAEIVEAWSVSGTKNIFGTTLNVQQLQAESGAAGAVHGSIAAGGLATTFTSSQGLLLMIPNMYKIAGELLPCVFHVAARALAGEALSIFGDHQDVMSTRAAGWAMTSAQSVQDAMDLALCAHLSTLKTRVPVLAFQDGFRTSHEVNTISVIDTDDMRSLIDRDALREHRSRGLSPLKPKIRGSNQNPDVYMQCLESANQYYEKVPTVMQSVMNDVTKITGRPLSLFRYTGHPEAEVIIVQMGSAVTVTEDVVEHAFTSRGIKAAVLSPVLFRPWCAQAFLEGLPKSVKTICVLDRTKEASAFREPLFLDVAASIQEDSRFMGVKLIGGRYGLGSKEYTPAHALTVIDNAASETPKDRFTVGINDDLNFTSLTTVPSPKLASETETTHCIFFGLAGDGTVGANKNAVKIIGDNTDLMTQAYFAYTSVKAGVATISHLRFGPKKLEMPYLIQPGTASYAALSFTRFIEVMDMVKYLKPEGNFVLNCPWKSPEALEANLPTYLKKQLAENKINFYVLDASKVAEEASLGKLTNNVMQTAFFKLSGVLEFNAALDYFRDAIKKSYKKRGEKVIAKNLAAVDQALESLHKVEVPAAWASLPDEPLPEVKKFIGQGDFAEDVQAKMVMMQGDDIPVSKFPVGGETPMGLSSYEKRAPSDAVPEVDMDKCTQCNYCSYVCPHAVIRPFLMNQDQFDNAPKTLDARKSTSSELAGTYFRIQVSAEDCTGCEVCVKMCPDDALEMVSQDRAANEFNHHDHWSYLRKLPIDESLMKKNSVKGSQMQQPLLEFSAACAGCGETPYVKLLTQLFGDRMMIANATGCTSIWGNPYGSAPYTVRDSDGKGPAWQNSLYEDNAEFGYGMLQARFTRRKRLHEQVGEALSQDWKSFKEVPELQATLRLWHQKWQSAGTSSQIADKIPALLAAAKDKEGSNFLLDDLIDAQDDFVKHSQWIVGGDGWAYDIGFGGLDHVLASGCDVNVLVLDTESYSNTGGQKSKATPAASIAKFAMSGKDRQKKNLGEIMMAYQHVYVASICMGSHPAQAVKAFAEAEEYAGPSLILAYAPCIEFKIAHEDGLGEMLNCQKLAVSSGYWPLYRFDPRLDVPLQMDAKVLKDDLGLYLQTEDRFNALKKSNPDKFEVLVDEMKEHVEARHARFLRLATAEKSVGEPLCILYGSETGNTAELAARFAGQCRNRGYAVELSALDDMSIEDLRDKTNVVIMIATCGEGALPQNARNMWEELGREEPGSLSNVNFAVFALGDKAYRHFCSAGYDFDRKFEELGAKRLQSIGIGDDKDEDKFETGFAEWLPSYWKTVQAPEDPKEWDPIQPLFELTPVTKNETFPSLAPPPGTKELQMNFNKRITSPDYAFSIRHLQFDSPDGKLPWLLGDALAVYPTNDEARVEAFFKAYGIDGDACYSAMPLEGRDGGRKEAQMEKPFQVKSVFVELLDLYGRPSKNFLKDLAKTAPERSSDRKRLMYLISDAGRDEFTKEIAGESLTIEDVLLKFPEAKPDLNQLIAMIPVIKPRLYTIASSTRDTPGKIDLTVITNEWENASGQTKRGLCTDYFERMDGGKVQVNCSITQGTFNFGEPDVPMVMTGTGTGIAPFLAFAKERDWLVKQGGEAAAKAGEMWLFYGCRNKTEDYILGDDLDKLADRNIITHLRPAFSRDGPKKVYIQDKIKEDAVGVYNALVTKKGYLYLCGQAGDREKDLLNSVMQAFVAGGGISEAAAQKELDALIEEGRYCPELY